MTKKIETYKDKVNILVESGFKINNLSDRKQNVLHTYLCKYSNDTSEMIHEIINFFVKKGVNVNC